MATRLTRNDPHRPSQIRPADYEYVAPELIPIEGMGDVDALRAYRARIEEHRRRTGGSYSGHIWWRCYD